MSCYNIPVSSPLNAVPSPLLLNVPDNELFGGFIRTRDAISLLEGVQCCCPPFGFRERDRVFVRVKRFDTYAEVLFDLRVKMITIQSQVDKVCIDKCRNKL